MTGDRSDERPEGIEERLRSSLRAYADLVDAPARRAPEGVVVRARAAQPSGAGGARCSRRPPRPPS